MTQKKLHKIMEDYNITPYELDDVISFVADLLYVQARELEEEEPYATRTIDSLYAASREVDGLVDYVADVNDNDEEGKS